MYNNIIKLSWETERRHMLWCNSIQSVSVIVPCCEHMIYKNRMGMTPGRRLLAVISGASCCSPGFAPGFADKLMDSHSARKRIYDRQGDGTHFGFPPDSGGRKGGGEHGSEEGGPAGETDEAGEGEPAEEDAAGGGAGAEEGGDSVRRLLWEIENQKQHSVVSL